MNVIWISNWPIQEVKTSGGAYAYLQMQGWVPSDKTVFIFDDAQASFEDVVLWNDFFKTIHGYDKRRAIAFIGYGSPMSRTYTQGIPIEWNDSQRVTLRPIDHGDGLPAVGLFFSREEFDDLIFRQYPILEYHFHSSFLDSVFHLTAGHVGAVLAFVTVIVGNDVSLLYQYLAELMI